MANLYFFLQVDFFGGFADARLIFKRGKGGDAKYLVGDPRSKPFRAESTSCSKVPFKNEVCILNVQKSQVVNKKNWKRGK